MLVPDEGQVVAAANGDVQLQVQGASLDPEVHMGLGPTDCVVPIRQHDGQALGDRDVTGCLPPRPGPLNAANSASPPVLSQAGWTRPLGTHVGQCMPSGACLGQEVLEHHGYCPEG